MCICVCVCLFASCREKGNDEGQIHVYPSRLGGTVGVEHTVLPVTSHTCVTEVISLALNKFDLPTANPEDYRLVEVMLDKGGECPVLNAKPTHVYIFAYLLINTQRVL